MRNMENLRSQVRPSQLSLRYQANEEDSDGLCQSYKLNNDDYHLHFSQELKKVYIKRLQNMRQAAGKTLKSYLSRFTDEITYYKKTTDREAFSSLKRGLNINTLFWMDVLNRNS